MKMSTTAITVQAPPVSRSIPAIYATATAITVSAVSAAPTPIYRFYRETLGLTPFTITLIVAVYAFTMIAAFLTIARLSDYVGRKPMILLALGLNALALLLFFVAESAAMLIAARAVQGVATGVALATLGAVIVDTAPGWAATLNSVTAFLGLALGALISGVFVTFAPWPTHLVYAALLGVTLAEIIILAWVAETTSRKPGAWSGIRPKLTVPAAAAAAMARLFPLTLSAWALGGFYLLVDALARDRGDRDPLPDCRRRGRLGVDGLRGLFVVRDARPRRGQDGAPLGGVARRWRHLHCIRHCSRLAGGHVLRNGRRGLGLRRILWGVAAGAPAARLHP
ncbi:MAG TPA: MFS transporter [Rhizomicrobium sp.]